VPVDPVTAAERRAQAAWEAAGAALERLTLAMTATDSGAARNHAVIYGILSDQSARAEKLLVELRTSHPQVTESVLDAMAFRLRGCLRALGHDPDRDHRVAAVVAVWFTGPVPDTLPPVADVRPAQPSRGAVAPPQGALPRPPADKPIDAGDAEPVEPTEADDTPDADDDDDDAATMADADDTPVEPEPEPEPEPVELVEMAAVPAAWFARFKMDPAGRERCRVAYSTQLAKQRRAKQAREQAAKAADDAAAIERAAARAANPPPPLPAGWDRGGGRRGPAGRAGW